MSVAIKWNGSLEKLSNNITKWDAKTREKIDNMAHQIAAEGRAYQIANAPWTDRTGRARRFMRGYVTKEKHRTIITFSHGQPIYYGVYLELKNGGRFAIVRPTTMKFADETMRRLRKIAE